LPTGLKKLFSKIAKIQNRAKTAANGFFHRPDFFKFWKIGRTAKPMRSVSAVGTVASTIFEKPSGRQEKIFGLPAQHSEKSSFFATIAFKTTSQQFKYGLNAF
jgi:hypothetical protein